VNFFLYHTEGKFTVGRKNETKQFKAQTQISK